MADKSNFWWYITLQGPWGGEEILTSLAELSGCVGCEEAIKAGCSCVQAYYSGEQPLSHWTNLVTELAENWPDVTLFDTGKIENRPWHTEWMEAYPPLNVGENLVVMAPWHAESFQGSRTPLYIRPGSAFGTGYHESTQGILTLLERHIRQGDVVCDIGCGSGILSLAALKLGASKVYARDLDGEVLSETLYNLCELNNLDPSLVDCAQGDLLKGFHHKVDLLMANILFEPLSAMISSVKGVLKENGRALFAGMVEKEGEKFCTYFDQYGLELIDKVQLGDWVAFAVAVKR